MLELSFKNAFVSISTIFIILLVRESLCQDYGKGFFNHSRCLYTYLEGGELELKSVSGNVIYNELSIDDLDFDSTKTRCTNDTEHGRIVFSFKVNPKTKIKSVTLSLRIAPSLSEGYWEVSEASLAVVRADSGKKKTFPLAVNQMYASLAHSYSCNKLTLNSYEKKSDTNLGKQEASVSITLNRFQIQPFPELDSTVFAPSFDCSTWVTLPSIMGLALILFMVVIVVISIIFLQNITTNDFKYSKEGLLFTQQQMESNKHQ